jgi:TRAP-type mannitol/chloroaromatic compound transport system substrate-binding protein
MKRRELLKKGAVGLGAIATAGVISAPAIASNKMEITMVSTWPRDFPGLGTGAQRFAESLKKMSDGRMEVKYYAADERVKPFDSFDEVASGNAHIYHGAEYYWKGKHPAFSYFATVPFGLTCAEFNAWINFGGGQQLWDELSGQFGIVAMPCGNTGVQMGGWFRKEMKSVDDFKGLKMRIPGLGGDVMSKLGVSPVSLPGGQIYENLVSGAIDATEWVGPWNDSYMKFYEATKFYYTAGMHEPGTCLSAGFNKKWFEALSKSDQALIRAAANQENTLMMAEYDANNGTALKNLIVEHGVELRDFSDEIYDSFGEAAAAVFEETSSHSDLAKKVNDSFINARAKIGAWMGISDVAYLRQRNRVLGL